MNPHDDTFAAVPTAYYWLGPFVRAGDPNTFPFVRVASVHRGGEEAHRAPGAKDGGREREREGCGTRAGA